MFKYFFHCFWKLVDLVYMRYFQANVKKIYIYLSVYFIQSCIFLLLTKTLFLVSVIQVHSDFD